MWVNAASVTEAAEEVMAWVAWHIGLTACSPVQLMRTGSERSGRRRW